MAHRYAGLVVGYSRVGLRAVLHRGVHDMKTLVMSLLSGSAEDHGFQGCARSALTAVPSGEAEGLNPRLYETDGHGKSKLNYKQHCIFGIKKLLPKIIIIKKMN